MTGRLRRIRLTAGVLLVLALSACATAPDEQAARQPEQLPAGVLLPAPTPGSGIGADQIPGLLAPGARGPRPSVYVDSGPRPPAREPELYLGSGVLIKRVAALRAISALRSSW